MIGWPKSGLDLSFYLLSLFQVTIKPSEPKLANELYVLLKVNPFTPHTVHF